jgi:heme exporter protein C
MRSRSKIALPAITAVALLAAYSMVFFYAPIDADQGFLQKIFYLHVPLAIVTLCGFIAGAAMAGMFLRTGNRRWDARSYVAIHVSLILGIGGLVTGSIWAKASWGHWWVWQEPTLVSYLIILLLFCCYQPLRFAIEDPERQSRYAAVFALTAGAFIPVNFIAVRMASAYTHPRVFQVTGAQLPLSMGVTFVAALMAISLLHVTMCQFELKAKAVRARIGALERAALDRPATRNSPATIARPVRSVTPAADLQPALSAPADTRKLGPGVGPMPVRPV